MGFLDLITTPMSQVLIPIGSRCRDTLTGHFLPLIECEPEGGIVDLAPIVKQFARFANEIRPSFEKGAEIAIVGIRDVAMAVPVVGKKESVLPAEFPRRVMVAGYIHNHPSGGVALSGADVQYAAYLSSITPLRNSMLAIAVHQFNRVGEFGDIVDTNSPGNFPVIVGLVPLMPSARLQTLFEDFDFRHGLTPREPGHIQLAERLGIRLWEFPVHAMKMSVPNVFFKVR